MRATYQAYKLELTRTIIQFGSEFLSRYVDIVKDQHKNQTFNAEILNAA